MIRTAIFLSTLSVAMPAAAQNFPHISSCDPETRVDTVVEPWEDHTATFGYQGAVRIALLDMTKPRKTAKKLLILTPPRNEYRKRYCFTMAHTEEQGFVSVDFAAMTDEFEQSVGLLFKLPVVIMDGDEKIARRLVFAVNEATASVQAVLQDPSIPDKGDEYSAAATASHNEEPSEDDGATAAE